MPRRRPQSSWPRLFSLTWMLCMTVVSAAFGQPPVRPVTTVITVDAGKATTVSVPAAKPPGLPVCEKNVPVVRKEWRTLTKAEQTQYLDAVLEMQKRPKEGGLSPYEKLVKVHGDGAGPIHAYAPFLVWHRYFLTLFEKELQVKSKNSSIAIPYWKFELDSQAPELAPIWSDETFGKNGDIHKVETYFNYNNDFQNYTFHCVTTGVFKNLRLNASGIDHCLGRWWADERGSGKFSSKINSHVPPELINNIIVGSSTYDEFRVNWEEAPHGTVHDSIGGDMLTMYSPGDPIFWLFHANIDKVYHDWQNYNKAQNFKSYNGQNQDGTIAKAEQALPLFSNPSIYVKDLFDVTYLCYKYEEYTPIKPAVVIAATTPSPPPATVAPSSSVAAVSSPTTSAAPAKASSTPPTGPPGMPPKGRPDAAPSSSAPASAAPASSKAPASSTPPSSTPTVGGVPLNTPPNNSTVVLNSATNTNVTVVDNKTVVVGGNVVTGGTDIKPAPVAPPSTNVTINNVTNVQVVNTTIQGLAPSPGDRSSVDKLNTMGGASDDWNRRNGIDPKRAARLAGVFARLIADINSIQGFISTVAIISNPAMMEQLISQGEALSPKVTVGNKVVEVSITSTNATAAVTEVLDKLREAIPSETTPEVKNLASQLVSVIGPIVTTVVSAPDGIVAPTEQVKEAINKASNDIMDLRNRTTFGNTTAATSTVPVSTSAPVPSSVAASVPSSSAVVPPNGPKSNPPASAPASSVPSTPPTSSAAAAAPPTSTAPPTSALPKPNFPDSPQPIEVAQGFILGTYTVDDKGVVYNSAKQKVTEAVWDKETQSWDEYNWVPAMTRAVIRLIPKGIALEKWRLNERGDVYRISTNNLIFTADQVDLWAKPPPAEDIKKNLNSGDWTIDANGYIIDAKGYMQVHPKKVTQEYKTIAANVAAKKTPTAGGAGGGNAK